ncbi:HNH endonuclease [Deinococcus alpinitundrae]|uniref:HNH endonuclease n=1 Tax=Deinococcus alpinitundrae TaxID=468913 RepID=UPI00137A8665|nr:HNH endonuclease [Deinococcus alpinitundrae]
MKYLVLSSRREDNPYGDTDETYIFPKTYLARFASLDGGEPILAIVYEPRRGGGQQQYVSWGLLNSPPTARPDGQWEVRYDGKLIPLPVPSSLTSVEGTAFELRLQAVPRQRWGTVLQGQSVRSVTAAEAVAILCASGLIGVAELPAASIPLTPIRAEELVRRSVRDRGFRGQVLSAYAFQCALTGFRSSAGEARALLEAAHVRPVAAAGSDNVRNGLSLTAGVHRLYDEGLITFGYVSSVVEMTTSIRLQALSFEGQLGKLRFESGTRLILPNDARAWPDPEALAWHGAHVFRR